MSSASTTTSWGTTSSLQLSWMLLRWGPYCAPEHSQLLVSVLLLPGLACISLSGKV